MSKLNLEYVMSGMSMTRIVMKYDDKPFYPEFCSVLENLTQSTIKRLSVSNKNTSSLISCLYNGFTESSLGPMFSSRNKNGCTSLYADSGGLQIITAGKSITPELKTKVYEAQAYSDYGFCFDTIPLKSISSVRSKSERSNVANKLFTYDDLEDAAKQTGRDIIEQLTYFDKSNASTKGMIIVQGNTWQDMVEWFGHIIKIVPESLKHKIGGIAVADTCMGNGELESIEMLRAVREIHDTHGEEYTKHIHLLGVGALGRMAPVINLINSGYIGFTEKVSYDSTSHTSSAYMGKFFVDGSHKRVSKYRTPQSEDIFNQIYDRHEGVFAPLIDKDKFIDCTFAKKMKGIGDIYGWDTSATIQHVNENDYWETACVKLIPYAYVLHTVENFMTCLDKLTENTNITSDPISHLCRVKSTDDFDRWYRTFAGTVGSKRISRKLNTLDAFFED